MLPDVCEVLKILLLWKADVYDIIQITSLSCLSHRWPTCQTNPTPIPQQCLSFFFQILFAFEMLELSLYGVDFGNLKISSN